MDYVQSVLVRQRQLLSLLLLGREQERKQETERSRQTAYSSPEAQAALDEALFQRIQREDMQQPEAADGGFWSGAAVARFQESLEPSMAARRKPETQTPVRQYGRMPQTQTPVRQYGQTPESSTPYMTGGGISGDGGVQSAGAWSAAAAADVTRRDAQAAVFGPWQEALSARAVSLAFERDARRYDGGFSLY